MDEAQEAAQKARDNPNLAPLVKGPQEYLPVDAVVAATADFGPGDRAAWVKQSIDLCEKKGVLAAGYIPKAFQTNCLANSEGLFADYHTRRPASSSPAGWRAAADPGGQASPARRTVAGERRRAHRNRREQSAEKPEAPRNRAGPLHDNPRATACARFMSTIIGAFNAGGGGGGFPRRRRRWRRIQLRRHRPAVRQRRRQPEAGQKLFSDSFTVKSESAIRPCGRRRS